MNNRHPQNTRTHDLDQDEFAEVLVKISEWIETKYNIRWPEIVAKYPQFEEQLNQIRPAFEGVMAIGAVTESICQISSDLSEDMNQRKRPLGDFQLVREIGRGGMGVVYEARQLSLDRTVALKVLPLAALIEKNALIRFRNEVLAAASLDHAHIVSVYSMGEDRGVHYYAMQLIRGQSLAEIFLTLTKMERQTGSIHGGPIEQIVTSDDQKPRDVVSSSDHGENDQQAIMTRAQGETRTKQTKYDPAFFKNVVRLGIQAAEALDHAHHRGVIHRDIKPGNLLVDRYGQLFVTDFGLARIETAPGVTMTGDFLGTLRYMSPEQILANRVLIDHRTDIYSLGLTLYEMLTLRPAFSADERFELIRQVSFDDPVALSTANPATPKDLETIILKAIRKDPAERYETAQDFAADLQRFLDQLPIVAKRPTIAQRIVKWSRRHPSIMWSAALLLLIVSIGSVTASLLIWHANNRTRAALTRSQENFDEAARQKTAAERRAIENQTVVDFLVNDMISAADPQQVMGGEATLLDVIRKAEIGIGETFSDSPWIEASVRYAIARVYESIGDYESARRHIDQVVELRLKLNGENDRQTLEAMTFKGMVMRSQGLYVESRNLLTKTRNLRLETLGEGHLDTLHTTNELVNTLNSLGIQSQTESLLRTALMAQSTEANAVHPDVLTCRILLALVMSEQGDHQAAMTILEEVYEIKKKNQGEAHADTLLTASKLCSNMADLGSIEQADELSKRGLQDCLAIFGEGHPRTLVIMWDRAMLLMHIGSLDDAKTLCEAAVGDSTTKLGAEHPYTLRSRLVLGAILDRSSMQDLSAVSKAEQICREVMQISDRNPGPTRVISFLASHNLALMLKRRGSLLESERVRRNSLENERAVLGPNHPMTLRSIKDLALVLMIQGKSEDAEPLAREAFARHQTSYGPQHEETLDCMKWLGSILGYREKFDEAEGILRDLTNIRIVHNGPEHVSTISAKRDLAEVLELQGRWLDAIDLTQECVNDIEAKGNEPNENFGELRHCYMTLARISKHSGDSNREHEYCAKLVRLIREFLARHPERLDFRRHLISALLNYADAANSNGRPMDAEKTLIEAVEMAKHILKADPDSVVFLIEHARCQSRVARLRFEQKRFEESIVAANEAHAAYIKIIPNRPTEEFLRDIVNFGRIDRSMTGRQLSVKYISSTDADLLFLQDLCDAQPENHVLADSVAHVFTETSNRTPRQKELALELAEAATTLSPENRHYWRTLGAAQFRNSQFNEAIESLQKSAVLYPKPDAERDFFLAMSRWQLGDRDIATRVFEDAIANLETQAQTDEFLALRKETETVVNRKIDKDD